MKYRQLGGTGPKVSVFCLGSMTWGEQNDATEAEAQLDMAWEHGVNFIDTAEMYPIAPCAETQGRSEEIIGDWLAKRGRRDDVILATKVIGRGGGDYYRDGAPRLDRRNIVAALEASLKRLGTDYIDLYQTHWPERATNFFGRRGYLPRADDGAVAIDETLGVLGDLVTAGKIRHIGISNETPWGVMAHLDAARRLALPAVVSIQNPYSLLNRTFEVGLAEIAHREGIGLLAYSPMAMGALSGKYLGGARPPGARFSLWSARYTRYNQPHGERLTARYVALATEHGLDPGRMALAFVHAQPFVTATISGATSLDQLASNLASVDIELSAELLEAIEAIHEYHPYPCP